MKEREKRRKKVRRWGKDNEGKIVIPENLEMLLGIFYFFKIFIIRHFLKLVLECGISRLVVSFLF